MTTNEAAERLRNGDGFDNIVTFSNLLDEALAAERRAFGKRVLANFSDRIDRAWGNEHAAKATDLLRWAVEEEAAR